MDFHSLSRKDLQNLCKKNKIPANKTNVFMADALAALDQVEGLEEFLNPAEPDAQQFQEEKVAGTPDIHVHGTVSRTSTRRKAVREEQEISKVSTRLHRGTREGNSEGVIEQENKDVNVSVTPAMPSRRRVPAVSTRGKKEPQMPEDEKNGVEGQGKPTVVPKTPSAAPSSRTRATVGTTSVQRAYNTRRSVRLLEKNLSTMSLVDTEDTELVKIDDDISEELSNVAQQTEDSVEAENGVVSEETDELEVFSMEKSTECDDCQSHDLDSEVQLGSAAENDRGVSLQAEPRDSNLKLEGGSETCNGSSEVCECFDKSIVGKAVNDDNEAGSQREDSCDSSEPENEKCVGTNKQDALSVEVSDQDGAALSVEVPFDASEEVTVQDVAALSVEVPADAYEEAIDHDVSGLLPISSVSNDLVSLMELAESNIDNQGGNDDDNQDKNNETEPWNEAYGSDIQNFEAMFDVDEAAADMKDLASPDSPEGVLDIGSSKFCSAGENQDEVDAESEHSGESGAEIEILVNASDVTGASAALLVVEKDAGSEDSVAVSKACNESSAEENMNVDDVTDSLPDVSVHKVDDQMDNSEELEVQAQPEESKEPAEAEETALDATSAFPCVQDGMCSPQISLIHQQVSVESALVAHKADDQKDNSEKLETQTLTEESEEPAEAEDTALGATSAFPCVQDEISGLQIPPIHQNVSVESALVVHKADDQKDTYEKLEAPAQSEESEECEGAEETGFDATSAFPSALDGIRGPQIPLIINQQRLVEYALYKADDQKDNSEKLEAEAQPEEFKEHAVAEETALGASAFPCALHWISSPQIPPIHQQISIESVIFNDGNGKDSCSSDDEGDAVIPEEIVIPKLQPGITAETMKKYKSESIEVFVGNKNSASIEVSNEVVSPSTMKVEQKTRDIPIQSIVAGQLNVANEAQAVPKMTSIEEDKHKVSMMKENLSIDELHKMSMRELKKRLKSLTLDGKSTSKTSNVAKEVGRKRTALKALPENRMTAGEAQHDG